MSGKFYAVTCKNIVQSKRMIEHDGRFGKDINKTGIIEGDPVRVFIDESFLDTFKHNAQHIDLEDEDDLEVYQFKVTENILYGQDAEGNNRSLVLHDPKITIHQA